MTASHRSAALALIRTTPQGREVLLVHPGGPFWAKKDEGAWSLPKGLFEPGEDALEAAIWDVLAQRFPELQAEQTA